MVRIPVLPQTPRRIPELLRKTGLVLAAVLVCEVGARIVAPGLNGQALRDFLQAGSAGWLLRVYDWFVGGALSRGAVLAIGIMPYAAARLYARLARVVNPRLDELSETEPGRAKLAQWTRWLAGSLALVQSYGFARFVEGVPGAVAHPGFGFLAKTMAVLTSGAIGVMLLSEQLTRSPRDDSPRPSDHAPASDVSPDRPVNAPSLGLTDSTTPLLAPGQQPDVEWHRRRREAAPVHQRPDDERSGG